MNGRVVRTEGEILTLTPTLTDTDTDTAIADAQGLIHPKANVINEEPWPAPSTLTTQQFISLRYN